jgi:hypothetical protein
MYSISNRIYTDCITLETKSTVTQWTTARCWIPNNEIRPTSKAGFDKIDITRLDPSRPYRVLTTFLSGVRQSPLVTAATTGLLYQPQMIDDGDCGVIGGIKIGMGNRSTRKTYPSATLSTINPTWPDPSYNLGRRGGNPATNCLSYGTAIAVKMPPSELLSGEMISIN